MATLLLFSLRLTLYEFGGFAYPIFLFLLYFEVFLVLGTQV